MTPDKKPIPVILDTDIGGDIDDTWALAMLLKSPELDLRLTVSATGDTTYRAKIIAKLQDIADRTDIPVGIGRSADGVDTRKSQLAWVDDYDITKYPGVVHDDGVGALIDAVMSNPDPVTLIAIGPLTNVAEAIDREPRIVERTRFVGMHGSINRAHHGRPKPCAEYNVKADIPACHKVFSAPWRAITITPLDTCGIVQLRNAKYRTVVECRDPVTRAVIENYGIWLDGKTTDRSSILFDTVAIYLAFASDLLKMESLGIRVDDQGYTIKDPNAQAMNCALEWRDLDAFEDLLVQRLCGNSK